MKAKYKIGYIDEDISQVKKYRRRFKKYGFEVIGYSLEQGMNLDDLMEQVYNSDIDLLMIDYKLNETSIVSFNGEEVESAVYDKKPQFPHIIFTNKVDQAEPYVEDLKIIFDKDDIFEDTDDDNVKVQRFIKTLERSIEQYRNHIKNKKDAIATLISKGELEGLSAKEKSDLLELQKKLQLLDKTKPVEIPEQLVTIDNLEQLSKARKDAEEFLKTLSDEE